MMNEETENFMDYCDKWQKAQEEGIFDDVEPIERPNQIIGFGGSSDENQDAYWKNIDREMQEEGLLQEDHAGTPTKTADLADQAKDIARAANPIYHHTIGADQDLEPWTPNWTDGKELKDLTELKVTLYELESECNKKDGLGESSDTVRKKIKEMWNKLNQLSNDLTPNRFKEILD